VCPGGVEAIPVDEAGNPKLRDIGTFLKSAIKKAIPDVDVKYIDPSNMVQVRDAAPAAPETLAWCGTLSCSTRDACLVWHALLQHQRRLLGVAHSSCCTTDTCLVWHALLQHQRRSLVVVALPAVANGVGVDQQSSWVVGKLVCFWWECRDSGYTLSTR